MIDTNFLKKYIETPSPVGFEMICGGQKVWIEEAKKYAEYVETDNYGNAFAYAGNTQSNYCVVLDAHADEISWLVSKISKEGFLSVVRNGGSDHQIAPSMRVTLFGGKGPVNGIFGHPAIHVVDRKDKIELKDLFVDIGAKDENEVKEMGIEVGTVMVFQDSYMELGQHFITGRALDDKLGGAINIAVLKKIKEENIQLPYSLVVVNSVQEEIGLRGAMLAAKKLSPDAAFIVDVCHEDSSPAYKDKQYKAGEGTVLTIAPAIHNNLLSFVRKHADKNSVKYSLAARSGSSGTNTDSYAYSNGAPSVLISIPLRYMHTTVETVHRDDIQASIDILFHALTNINEDQSFKYK